ncbi:permease [Frankia canadensis]|uniref:Permease n=1 Tax=Frankia canadensis TaxID=1836972 RepID=A0A2I2KM45_9ACTN|nr:hypothetical protein [Frankia canadensis]SNQ46733.1 permease [Frankia canadensis]SOU54023.1 permease [Frankia canadensis]
MSTRTTEYSRPTLSPDSPRRDAPSWDAPSWDEPTLDLLLPDPLPPASSVFPDSSEFPRTSAFPESPVADSAFPDPRERDRPADPADPAEPDDAVEARGRRRHGRRGRVGPRSGLAAVVAVQVLTSINLSSTAFQDEALYLDAGHQIIASLRNGTPTAEDFGSYFSGSPYVYPPLGALADALGGLAAARMLSLVCAVMTTLLVASVGRSLYGRSAGVAGATAFVLSGPVLFIGHFATYDAMALMLLTGGLAAGLRAAGLPRRARPRPGRRRGDPRRGNLWRGALWAFSAGCLLAAAVVTKYVAALFVPSAAALIVMAAHRTRRPAATTSSAPASAPPLVLLLAAAVGTACVVGAWLGLTGTDQLRGLVTTTLSRRPVGPTSAVEVARRGLEWAAPTLIVAVAGLPLVARRRPALAALLLGSSLLPIAVQARSGELTSLHKHVAFGVAFAAPLAGAGLVALLARLDVHDPRRPLAPRVIAAALAAVVLLAGGARGAQDLFQVWADSRPLTALLRTQVRFGSGHYLVEESEVPRYYLRDVTAPWQWNGTYFLYYRDPRTGAVYTGTAAYRRALTDRYFDIVVLRFGPSAMLDWKIHDILQDPTKYRQIARLPEPGGWTIWRRAES